MSTARAWHSVAVEALEAARMLTSARLRGQANRLYYALFAETHAQLLSLGQSPREKEGTWTHEKLPFQARSHLTKRLGRETARYWSQTLRNARHVREWADYRPYMHPGVQLVERLLNKVGELVEGRAG